MAARRIPYGETASYGEVAIMAGSPGAARAVGTAMSRNPISLVIPCHRVIRADGSIGGYGNGTAGIHLKRRLLDLEQHPGPSSSPG
jgi:methylated-DNA-[protein]-cysteine S-methyltransferase